MLDKCFGGWMLFDKTNGYNFYKIERINEIRIGRSSRRVGFSNERTINNLQRSYRKRFNTIGYFSFDQWTKLIKFYCPDLCCIRCKKKGFIIPDHILSASLGGSNDITNIQPICDRCNSTKGKNIIDYRYDKGDYNLSLFQG